VIGYMLHASKVCNAPTLLHVCMLPRGGSCLWMYHISKFSHAAHMQWATQTGFYSNQARNELCRECINSSVCTSAEHALISNAQSLRHGVCNNHVLALSWCYMCAWVAILNVNSPSSCYHSCVLVFGSFWCLYFHGRKCAQCFCFCVVVVVVVVVVVFTVSLQRKHLTHSLYRPALSSPNSCWACNG
jgi:hypothetical protein